VRLKLSLTDVPPVPPTGSLQGKEPCLWDHGKEDADSNIRVLHKITTRVGQIGNMGNLAAKIKTGRKCLHQSQTFSCTTSKVSITEQEYKNQSKTELEDEMNGR
jgi:hypothetical protein